MEIVCSPLALVAPRFPKQGVADIAEAGFRNISLDLEMCCGWGELEQPEPEQPWDSDVPRRPRVVEDPSVMGDLLAGMLEQCREKGVGIPMARAPYLLRSTKRRDLTDLTELLTGIIGEGIRLCGRIGCQYLVVRPLFAGVPRGEEWEANRAFYLRLGALARECGVTILLENQCVDFNGHLIRGLCAAGEDAADWVDRLNGEAGEERFGFCMDVGVCNLCGQNMRDFAMALGGRLKAVVLRDCDGERESAQLPFTCVGYGAPQTDWLNLIRGLRELGFDGLLLLDFHDTAGVFSPLLRPRLMALAKAAADYFQWQIGLENLLKKHPSRVLFGAGNMCRNYMKCYGEKYPPLFTCANNPASWGKDFCGLEVKPPESLRELPEDCAIFICNIYYREIEEQLREMGIKNPVEYFNDEYMPTFYFDRLKGR